MDAFAGVPQVAGFPQFDSALQSFGFRLPVIWTPAVAFESLMPKTKGCPFETIPSTEAFTVSGGANEAVLWRVPISELLLT